MALVILGLGLFFYLTLSSRVLSLSSCLSLVLMPSPSLFRKLFSLPRQSLPQRLHRLVTHPALRQLVLRVSTRPRGPRLRRHGRRRRPLVLRESPHKPRGLPRPELPGGDEPARGHDGAGAQHRARPDDGPFEQDRPLPQDGAVSHGGRPEQAPVPHGDVAPHRGRGGEARRGGARRVEHAAGADGRAGADADGVEVAAEDRAVEDGDLFLSGESTRKRERFEDEVGEGVSLREGIELPCFTSLPASSSTWRLGFLSRLLTLS